MKKFIWFLSVFAMSWAFEFSFVLAQDDIDQFQRIHIASSPNPVGSGARAMGMGGAFIGVADDATAASWNPGGLIQVQRPEISLVGNWFDREEDNTFGLNPEADGKQSVSGEDVNYASITYPFEFINRNMVVSVNYQNLYNFTQEWNYQQNEVFYDQGFEITSRNDAVHTQSGTLSAIGLAGCFEIIHDLSFGFTLNFWDDDMTPNSWEVKDYGTISGEMSFGPEYPPFPFSFDYSARQSYTFRGFNFNLGLMWRATEKLTVGLVFKSPFTADLKYEKTSVVTDEMGQAVTRESSGQELDMPMSYGVGLAYRFSDKFTLSADLYRTEWGDFIQKDALGNKTSPINGKPEKESNIDPTHQARIGVEYLIYDPQTSKFVIPLRAGLFYDPAPAEGSPDDFFGYSLGSGFATGRFEFDLAFQQRIGNDVGAAITSNYDHFSQDVNEYMVYASFTLRLK